MVWHERQYNLVRLRRGIPDSFLSCVPTLPVLHFGSTIKKPSSRAIVATAQMKATRPRPTKTTTRDCGMWKATQSVCKRAKSYRRASVYQSYYKGALG